MTDPLNVPDNPRHAGTITSIGELIGIVPLMLGFRPVDSLILVTSTTSAAKLSGLMRADLPGPDTLPNLVAQLRDALVTGDVSAVTVVIVGGEDTEDTVPAATLIGALSAELHTAGITVGHSVAAPTTDPGTHWRCYDPCECHGTIPALASSSVATSLITAGATTSGSRELLAATLAADPDEQLQRRTAMLHTRMRSHTASQVAADPARGYRIVWNAVTAAATHHSLPDLSDDQIVGLALALSNPEVRDRCLVASLPTTIGAAAESAHARAAYRLWTLLTRAVPGPARAEPAILLAVHTHLRGHGVLAGIALEIAQESNPAHLLARLLHLATQRGMPPAQLHQLLHSALATHRDATDDHAATHPPLAHDRETLNDRH